MKVRFEGGRELQAALRELATTATAKNVVKRALDQAATPIMDEAKNLAPDDPVTGSNNFLKASIQVGERALGRRNRNFRRTNGIVERYIGINPTVHPRVAFYSEIQEFGKGSSKAQPYMRPAWESKKTIALERLGDDLRVQIGKAAERAARKARKL